MKQVSQQEFEQYVIDIINGEKTQTQVVKELQTEARTLIRKIQELSTTNPELYRRYAETRPYKPKVRTDVTALELGLEILRGGKTIVQIAQEHKTGIRTVSRRINSLKNSNNTLERETYRLCKIVTESNSRGIPISPEIQDEIYKVRMCLMEVQPDEKTSSVESKRRKLQQIKEQYEELCKTMSKAEAAERLGYTRNRMFKLLNELERIELEAKHSSKTDKKSSFYDSLKVDVKPISNNSNTNNKAKQEPDKRNR